VYCVWQVFKTPTIISNNPVFCNQDLQHIFLEYTLHTRSSANCAGSYVAASIANININSQLNATIRDAVTSRPAASPVHYTTSCKHSLLLLRMGKIIARNMLTWLELSIKLFILLYQWCTVTQTSNLSPTCVLQRELSANCTWMYAGYPDFPSQSMWI